MRRGRWRRRIGLALVVPVLVLALFVAEGLSPAWRVPEAGVTRAKAAGASGGTVRVLAYNIAKCWAYAGFELASTSAVRRCLREVARVVRSERPDLVFLSEIVKECGPRPVDQVGALARATGMHAWVFGENYRWGLPFFRVRAGNAILSRWPLRAVETQALPGPGSLFLPMGRRRLPWAEVTIDGQRLLVGSVRNDSFDLDNNLRHARAIVRKLGRGRALLAGDFNAPQGSPPMRAYERSGLFAGELQGPFTYPARRPDRTIDYVLAPREWTLVEHHVPRLGPSDHLPVVSTFRLPASSPLRRAAAPGTIP